MKLFSHGLMATLAASVSAEVLFLDTLRYKEYDEAESLGLNPKTVTLEEWNAMKTEDFSKYEAIVIPDPSCGSQSRIKFFEDSKAVWSPAVTGNVVLIGTDPTFHYGTGKAETLIENSLKFAAAGKDSSGSHLTGLYFALSCYWNSDPGPTTVDALSEFGTFKVRGDLDCYNKVKLVATSPAIDTLDDPSLSDWSCSVHEAFSEYPTEGINAFQALAIADGVLGVGSKPFGEGIVGLPYILSRGATPAKCGDGVWDKELGEECDDGNTENGDGCSLSCKCESGKPKGDGTCLPKDDPTPDPDPDPEEPCSCPCTCHPGDYTPTPEVPPTCPSGPIIIGIEVIVIVEYIETKYVPCSTLKRPIYDAPTSVLPCYICQMSSEGISYEPTHFITVTTTHCPDCKDGVMPTPVPPEMKPCKTCEPYTFTGSDCTKLGDHTEYPAVPYKTPTPHVHSSTLSEYPAIPPTETEYPDESYKPEYPPTSPPTPDYPVTPSEKSYTTPTGTGKMYVLPTLQARADFTGGAPKNHAARGFVGAGLVALAGMV